MSFIDQNSISCFVDQSGITSFIDQNGILLDCGIISTGNFTLMGQACL